MAADPTGLQPNTTYTVVLRASNAAGEELADEIAGAPVTFTTGAIAPSVQTGPLLPIADSVHLRGFLNPHNTAITDCHFEYGPTESYGQSVPCSEDTPGLYTTQTLTVAATAGSFRLSFEGQTTPDLPFDVSSEDLRNALTNLSSIGAGDVSVSGGPGDGAGSHPYLIRFGGTFIGNHAADILVTDGSVPLSGGAGASLSSSDAYNNADNEVGAELSGLEEGAEYHFRLVAGNGVGSPVAGADDTFIAPSDPAAQDCANAGMPGVGFLPDCRAWEMVSPPDKNGADVSAESSKTHAATGESARPARGARLHLAGWVRRRAGHRDRRPVPRPAQRRARNPRLDARTSSPPNRTLEP